MNTYEKTWVWEVELEGSVMSYLSLAEARKVTEILKGEGKQAELKLMEVGTREAAPPKVGTT